MNIRSVIKNVYMQIDELNWFLGNRTKSLGRHYTETYSQWHNRRSDPYTHTFDYDRADYISEVADIYHMKRRVDHALDEILEIYIDLLDIIKCDGVSGREAEDLGEADDPDKDIINVLHPNVNLAGLLDKAMQHDMQLTCIANRMNHFMYRTDKTGIHPFYIRGKYELWRFLRDNRLSAQGAIDTKQWSDVDGYAVVKHLHDGGGGRQ
jgi:hypothetical protein